jgi:hypothetical protein
MATLVKRKPGAGKLYGVFSRMAHDDHSALQTLYSPPLWIDVGAGERSIYLLPQKAPRPATTIANTIIQYVTEIAVRIAEVNGIDVVIPGLLVKALKAASAEESEGPEPS